MKTTVGWRIFFLVALVIVGLWLLIGSKPKESRPAKTASGKDRIKVVATIFPLADIAKQVGGERVNVITILPIGASPHTFEPTPQQVKDVSDARLFLEIGAGLEFWADKIIKSEQLPHLKTIVASEGIHLLEGDEHGHEHEHESGNPHIWLDPVLVKGIVNKIEKSLVSLDPEGTIYYQKMATDYLQELDRLDAEIKKTVAGFRVREYITFHPAWAYFGLRYKIKEAGVIEETPGREPTPKQVKAIIDNIRKSGIKAVFAEPQFSSRTAEAIAENTGAKVLFLDPIGNPEIPNRSTYLDLMRYNLKVMKEVME